MHVQNLTNSLWDIRIFLGLVPKESHCIWWWDGTEVQCTGITRWAYNTETSVLGLGCEGVDWIYLALAWDSFHRRFHRRPGLTYQLVTKNSFQWRWIFRFHFLFFRRDVPWAVDYMILQLTAVLKELLFYCFVRSKFWPWNGWLRPRQARGPRYDHSIICLCLQTARFVCFVNLHYEMMCSVESYPVQISTAALTRAVIAFPPLSTL